MTIDVGLLALIIIVLLMLLLISGMPVSFALLLIAGIGFFVIRGPRSLASLNSILFSTVTKDIYIALPTFIFMAAILEISGLGEILFEMMYKWMAGLRGGLAMGVIIISTFLAAMTGSAATAVLMMGMVAYPEMKKRGYAKGLMIGSIAAGGSLGPLIPPSVIMIIIAGITGVSTGRLFFAGFIPGLLASALYIFYIAFKCLKNPQMGPAIPKEERVSWGEKFKSLRLAGLPIILIFLVLGLIYFGVATPSEAGAVGAFGALICAAVNRNLSIKNLQKAAVNSIKMSAMLMWLNITGGAFSQLIGVIGVQSYLRDLVVALPISRWFILITILGLVYILGMFIDIIPISIITLPVFFPIIIALGFDPLWFCLLFLIDLLIGIMTPPFGMILFYFKGLNIPGVTMMDIYRNVVPYFLILLGVMILCIIFPKIVTWLPRVMV